MALCPGLPRWASTRKVKPIWILLKQETVSGSGISWAACKSAPRSRQITTPAPHHSGFYRPDALPAAQPTASKHWRQITQPTAYCNKSYDFSDSLNMLSICYKLRPVLAAYKNATSILWHKPCPMIRRWYWYRWSHHDCRKEQQGDNYNSTFSKVTHYINTKKMQFIHSVNGDGSKKRKNH